MGNTQTNEKNTFNRALNISHPLFENARLIKTITSKEFVKISLAMNSEKEYIEWTKNYKRIPKVNSALYPEETKFEQTGCCGSSGVAHVFFINNFQIQYLRFPYVLSEEVQIRRTNNSDYFTEKEIWLLLLSLVQSTEMFHIRRTKVGDIRPQNIFMNSEGDVKVLTQLSYPYGMSNYDKCIANRELITYLAPEEVKDIQFGKMKDQSDPLVVEAFSIGLTVLDAALLESSERFYEKNGIFAFDQLKESLGLLSQLKYSPELVFMISKICDPQPVNRFRTDEILKMLKPFENEIMSKKAFNIKALPSGMSKPNIQPVNPINPINPIKPVNPVINPENNDPHKNPNNKNPNINPQRKDEYVFVPGVVFDAKDEILLQSTLMHGKEIPFRYSKTPNTYTLSEQEEVANLNSPVQTTIYYPPITIQLPPPVHHNGHGNNHV